MAILSSKLFTRRVENLYKSFYDCFVLNTQRGKKLRQPSLSPGCCIPRFYTSSAFNAPGTRDTPSGTRLFAITRWLLRARRRILSRVQGQPYTRPSLTTYELTASSNGGASQLRVAFVQSGSGLAFSSLRRVPSRFISLCNPSHFISLFRHVPSRRVPISFMPLYA